MEISKKAGMCIDPVGSTSSTSATYTATGKYKVLNEIGYGGYSTRNHTGL